MVFWEISLHWDICWQIRLAFKSKSLSPLTKALSNAKKYTLLQLLASLSSFEADSSSAEAYSYLLPKQSWIIIATDYIKGTSKVLSKFCKFGGIEYA